MKMYICTHLVKSEDLNHHGTLYAGRMADWFIEGSFIAAARLTGTPDNIVCAKLHGLRFGKPATKGDIIQLSTRVVYAGTTSMTVYGKVVKNDEDEILVEGFVTFVYVDENGKKKPHNLDLGAPANEEDARLREIARTLR